MVTGCVAYGQNELKHTDTIQRSFRAPKVVDIDNISGFVHVIGYGGKTVEMTAVRTDEAKTPEGLARAVRDVALKTDEANDELNIYPDGPFRQSSHHSHESNPGYHFRFDITVRVPASTVLKIGDVNGRIQVEGVSGEYDVHSVNGGVEMKDIGGWGKVASVNGKLLVAFAHNPTQPCSFKTVNGVIDVQLRSGLAAEIRFKTLNGGVFTDFETSPMSGVPGTAERQNGKFVYRNRGQASVKVGNGGPLLSFETVNGAIEIHKK